MYCLKNYIGIKGCGQQTPEGGYINMLPGITLKSVQSIANSEQVTFLSVFDDIQDRAWLRFETDLRNALRAKYSIKSNRGFYNLKTLSTGIDIPPSENYSGFAIDAGIDENGFFAFTVASISINLPESVSGLEIFVFNREGVELDKIIIDAVAGNNTFNVGRTYAASLLFIAIDTTAISVKETTITSDLEGFYNVILNFLGDCCSPAIYGAQSDLDSAYQLDKISNTFGLSAKITPVCDYSSVVCNNKVSFKNAWLNLLGAEIMLETLYSERMNRFTTTKGEQAENLRDLFTGEYENFMQEAVKGIRINAGDACIECKQTISRKERLP